MNAERLLSRTFLETHPSDAALLLERLPADQVAALLDESPTDAAAAVLQRMASPSGADVLARLSGDRTGAILGALPLDTGAGLLRRISPAARDRLLESAPADLAAPLRRLLHYPEGTAGALMDPRILALPLDVGVGEARTRVRRAPRHVLYYLYVVDREQRLVGVLNLRELMLAPTQAPLATVMRSSVARVSAQADRQAVVAHPGWREFHALPVVERAGTLVGAIRYETFRQLEAAMSPADPPPSPLATALTLGELCWIGLASLLGELATAASPPPPRSPQREERHHDTAG